ncbi:YdcF family protein [Nocardia nova]|uniref:YdcF family protein n=1 Tax=Nocardia nova TaxID=37330 RepID=UPI0033D0DC9F
MSASRLPDAIRSDVEILWAYNQMNHSLRTVDVAVGLGSHDLGVATYAADLYGRGVFPLIVFTGANAPTTIARFPDGEAEHYRRHALGLGVPDSAMLVEPKATNTRENIELTRDLLDERGLLESIGSVLLISRPYQQRRSYATCRKWWPEVDVICGSMPLSLDAYLDVIDDRDRVINMLVGDTQRVWVYAERGWAVGQDVPDRVRKAYANLTAAGFDSRVIPGPASADI